MDDTVLTRDQSRDVDRRAIETYGFSGLVLMENAGRGVVDRLERIGIGGPVVILCGKGNNAGDGFVIARHLEIRGHECRVILLGPSSDLSGDAATNFSILAKTDVPIVELTSDEPAVSALLDRHATGGAWLVDAMLGTGARGEPRPPFDEAIDWMNRQPGHKLAVDVPSGLDCDTGQAARHTVHADHTCTFVAAKTGLVQAAQHTGRLHVVDIGTPPRLLREVLAGQA